MSPNFLFLFFLVASGATRLARCDAGKGETISSTYAIMTIFLKNMGGVCGIGKYLHFKKSLRVKYHINTYKTNDTPPLLPTEVDNLNLETNHRLR